MFNSIAMHVRPILLTSGSVLVTSGILLAVNKAWRRSAQRSRRIQAVVERELVERFHAMPVQQQADLLAYVRENEVKAPLAA